MAIIYSYPTVVPTADDLVLGTDVNQTDKPTKNFTIQSIVDIVQGGATGLGAVLAISADALQQPATNFTNIQGSGAVTFGSFTDGTMNIVGGVGTGFSSFASTSFTGKLDTGSFNQNNIRTLGILTGLQIANATPNVNLIDTAITAPGLDTSLVTEKAVVDYVATNPTSETLTEVLANGNQSGGVNSIDMTGAISNVTFIDSINPANPTSRAQGRATFGTGNDLQIYFNGTDGHIEQLNDANLIISGKEIKIQTSQLANPEDMIKAVSDGEVILYHNGTDKIQTSSTGVSVNGVIKASDGANNGPSYSFTSAANTGMYSPATNEIEFVTNGAARLKISSTGLDVTGAIDASGSIEGLSFTTDTTTSSTLMTRFILSTDGIANFSNNTMVPTTQAVKEYADSAVGTSTLSYQGDAATFGAGSQPFSLNLATGTFDITGGSNISTTSTAVAGNIGIITVNLDDAVTITGQMQAGTFSDGTFSGSAGTYTGGVSIESDTFTATTTPVGFIGNATTASALLSSGAIALSGDTVSTGGPHTYTSGGAVTIPTTIADTTVTGKVLTNLPTPTSGSIAATDTILAAMAKLQGQITSTTGLSYEGVWDASGVAGGSPDLTQASRKVNGHFYIVDTAGDAEPNGAGGTQLSPWNVGDWCIYVANGSATDEWQKLDQSNEVLGSGAANKIARWTSTNTLATGLISDNGSTVSIGDTGAFEVLGNTTLGNADTDTTTVKGPAHFEETLRADVGISLGSNNYGAAGFALTSGGGAASVNTWTELTIGTVTSVGLTETGNALTITGSPITGSGTINIAGAGVVGSNQYINGFLNLVDFPTLDNYVDWKLQGDSGTNQSIIKQTIVDFAGGTKISTAVTTNATQKTLTINHVAQGNTGATDTQTLTYGGTFAAISAVPVDTTGHLTGQTVKTFTMPTNPLMGIASTGAGGAQGLVPASAAGDQLKFLRADRTWVVPTDLKGIETINTTSPIGGGGSSSTVTITHDSVFGTSGSGTTGIFDSVTVDAKGHVIAGTNPGGSGGGIFSGDQAIPAAANATLAFTLTRAATGTLIFDVFLTSETSNATSQAMKFSVAHSYNTAPVFNKVVDTGLDGTTGFTVEFKNSNTGATGTSVICEITSAGGVAQNVGYTVQVGHDSTNALTFTAAS